MVMSSEKDNILGFNQYMKSDKIPYIIYAESEYLIKKQVDVQKTQTTLCKKAYSLWIFNVNKLGIL